jgi:hypothetical protein
MVNSMPDDISEMYQDGAVRSNEIRVKAFIRNICLPYVAVYIIRGREREKKEPNGHCQEKYGQVLCLSGPVLRKSS